MFILFFSFTHYSIKTKLVKITLKGFAKALIHDIIKSVKESKVSFKGDLYGYRLL